MVDQERLNKINLIDESVTVATSEAYGITSVGQLVATIKIIPFSVKKSVLTSVNKAIGNKPLISISRFNKKAIGLIMTRLPGMKENILDKTLKVAEGRITEFNSQITKEIRCEHRQSDVANAIEVMKNLVDDVGLVAEVVVQVARGNRQVRGDVIGGDVAFAPFVEQFEAGEQDLVSGFHDTWDTYCC